MVLSFASVCSAATEVKNDGSWKITATSDNGNTVGRAVDGDSTTYWHTKFTVIDGKITSHDECPHTITIDFGKEMTLSGWHYKPRQDSGTGSILKYNIYASTDGKSFKKIYSGEFKYTWENWANGEKPTDSEASWGDMKMRAVKIETISSIGGYGTAAEIYFLKGSGGTQNGDGAVFEEKRENKYNTLSKADWQIKASSELGWSLAKNMIDGTTETYWHSNYTAEGGTITSRDETPYTIELTLPKAMSSTGLLYTPRKDNRAGRWLSADVYVSADGKTKGDKVGTIKGERDSADEILLSFGKELSVKNVTIEVTEAVESFGTCAELDLVTGEVKAKINTLSKADWQIKASSEVNWGSAENMIDGTTKKIWHSNYTAEGQTITGRDEPPYTIELTLPKATASTGLLYTPRQDGSTGRWLSADVYVSADGKTKGDKVGTIKGKRDSADEILLPFDKELSVKKITIEVTETSGLSGSCAELDLVTGEVKTEIKEDPTYPEGYLDPSNWVITSSSEVEWSPIGRAFDNKLDTTWHTRYTAEGTSIIEHDMPPFTIDITLPEKKAISGFKIIGRTSNTVGRVKAYELFASETDGGEMVLISKGELSGSTSDEVSYGIGFEAKKLKFVVTEGQEGYACMAELQFKKAGENEKIYPVAEFADELDSVALKKIDPSGFKAENDLPVWGGNSTKNLFDGAAAFWQTEAVPVGTESTVLRIDLGKVYTFSAVSIYPRQSSDLHGYWDEFNMWVGTNDADMTELLHGYSFGERTLNEKTITFEKPVTARYVEFEITKFLNNRVSCAEISFWQTKEEREASGGTGKFVMQIGSNEIKVTKGGVETVKTIDTAPYITSAGRTLIPLRGLIEEMGAEIEWTDKNQSIAINNNGIKLYLQIRNNLVYVDSPAYGHLMYTLESEPRIKDSRTFVPLRFISEQFGYNVSWDGETKTITIEK